MSGCLASWYLDLTPAPTVPLPCITEHPHRVIAAKENDPSTLWVVRGPRRAPRRRHRLDTLPFPAAPHPDLARPRRARRASIDHHHTVRRERGRRQSAHARTVRHELGPRRATQLEQHRPPT